MFFPYLVYVLGPVQYCSSMFSYVCGKHECLYAGLLSIKTRDMSENRHIVHTSNFTTVGQSNRRKKNAQSPKRSSNQAHERTARPCGFAVPKSTADARLSDNNQNPKILWSLFRSKHGLSSAGRS